MPHILIIEDDRAIADILAFNLHGEGYTTAIAYDGAQGLALAQNTEADLVLLDVMLPVLDGWSVLKELRLTKATPVILLTAREEEFDKIYGLELGADDYITKPFSMNELKARVKANLRRVFYDAPPQPDAPKADGQQGIALHPNLRQAVKEGTPIDLSAKEYALLAFLLQNRGKLYSRQELLEQVWEYSGFLGDVRAVDVMISRLREKVEDDPSNPTLILTRRGHGYYIE